MLRIVNICNKLSIASNNDCYIAMFDKGKLVHFNASCPLNDLVANKLFPDYVESFWKELDSSIESEWQGVFSKYYLLQQMINKLKGEKMYIEEFKGFFAEK